MARGRKRVAVVDTAMVDGKRQLLIIRRDNVEHLILTGGPQDLVIESGIPAAEPSPAPRRPAQPQPRPAAQAAAEPADFAAPIQPDRPVSREAVDRLRDLARPAPLAPRTALRHTALLRPVERTDQVIPMGPAPRVDNSAGSADDSAKPGPDGDGRTPMGGRGRFFRRIGHGDGR